MAAEPVISVPRARRLGWLERLYLPTVLKSLWLSGRRRAHERARGFEASPADPRPAHPDAFRGMPVLVSLAEGRPRCVACGLCAEVCPSRCIVVGESEDADDGAAWPRSFDLDMGRCTYCGLCEEVCPAEAIVMSPHVENAAFDRASLVFHREQLLVPAEYLEPRLRFLRRRRGQVEESVPRPVLRAEEASR